MQRQCKEARKEAREDSQTVWVWGFRAEELAGWPPDLGPVVVEELAAVGCGPVVVHSRARADFEASVGALPDRLPEAILLLEPDTDAGVNRPDRDDRLEDRLEDLFDSVIHWGDWPGLRRALAEVRRLPLLDQVADIAIAGWAEATADPDDGQLLGGTLQQLTPALRAGLSQDTQAQQLLLQRLRRRIWERRVAVAPPVDRMLAYAQTSTDARADIWVQTYLAQHPAVQVALHSLVQQSGTP